MASEDEIWLYGKETPAADVIAQEPPLFKLRATVKYKLTRIVNKENKVQGAEYSKGYDTRGIVGVLTVSGTFTPENSDWDATAFTGRPFDFLHYLKCLALGLDPASGNMQSSATYDCFHVLIKKEYPAGTPRAYAPGIFGTVVKNYYSVDSVDFDPSPINGNTNGLVGFTLVLSEVSDVSNHGRT